MWGVVSRIGGSHQKDRKERESAIQMATASEKKTQANKQWPPMEKTKSTSSFPDSRENSSDNMREASVQPAVELGTTVIQAGRSKLASRTWTHTQGEAFGVKMKILLQDDSRSLTGSRAPERTDSTPSPRTHCFDRRCILAAIRDRRNVLDRDTLS